MSFQSIISSLRIRTLFLSASGIILGNGIALVQGFSDAKIFIFSLLTAISLQILSNLANELGDFQKGTDNQQRTGPVRSIQKGALTAVQLKKMIYFWLFCSMVFGLLLVVFSFESLFDPAAIAMLGIGFLSMAAAIFYTIGNHAYGYHGWGDISVWFFFGVVSVLGSYYLQAKAIDLMVLLPASAMGFLATAVLNLNNIRDIENDRQFNKKTVCVRLGETKGKHYHAFLILAAFLFLLIYNVLTHGTGMSYLFLLMLPLFIYHIHFVNKHSGRILDRQFPILVIGTFLLAVLSVVGMIL